MPPFRDLSFVHHMALLRAHMYSSALKYGQDAYRGHVSIFNKAKRTAIQAPTDIALRYSDFLPRDGSPALHEQIDEVTGVKLPCAALEELGGAHVSFVIAHSGTTVGPKGVYAVCSSKYWHHDKAGLQKHLLSGIKPDDFGVFSAPFAVVYCPARVNTDIMDMLRSTECTCSDFASARQNALAVTRCCWHTLYVMQRVKGVNLSSLRATLSDQQRCDVRWLPTPEPVRHDRSTITRTLDEVSILITAIRDKVASSSDHPPYFFKILENLKGMAKALSGEWSAALHPLDRRYRRREPQPAYRAQQSAHASHRPNSGVPSWKRKSQRKPSQDVTRRSAEIRAQGKVRRLNKEMQRLSQVYQAGQSTGSQAEHARAATDSRVSAHAARRAMKRKAGPSRQLETRRAAWPWLAALGMRSMSTWLHRAGLLKVGARRRALHWARPLHPRLSALISTCRGTGRRMAAVVLHSMSM